MSSQKVEEKVNEQLNEMGEEKKDEILANFDRFKHYLGDKVHKGEKLGLNEEQLAKGAEKIGDYLAKHEEPRNREEKLLQELWKAGNQEERHKLAHILVKLVG
ncbi:DUF3243 domain-containing protein [Metabacillus iocasae]|uniref:Ribonucleotide monophosphatase NagD (HAD superfamily) n=1 Tax=Priestia iocasae TaxID=2291674 RepID=A0ABS2QYU3_9BACI|nr:DUF3243 domain-containing protein [Metabacillus iocasae]MBM7703639.1 ribonucleotide monophosphatase NagD (HAD superfamily) [Metabacillus iocasae]